MGLMSGHSYVGEQLIPHKEFTLLKADCSRGLKYYLVAAFVCVSITENDLYFHGYIGKQP